MKKLETTIGAHSCVLYPNAEADCVLIQPVERREATGLDREIEDIRSLTRRPFALAALVTDDWNRELSPWCAPSVYGDEDFTGGAEETLSYILRELIPALERQYGQTEYYLGGYSLAGLFALWGAYRTDRLVGVAAASPSVWYPDWDSFAATHAVQAENVYLSLGLKEEKTRHPVMSRVGDRIRMQQELLSSRENVRSVLEWNPGNHFTEPELRVAKGFAWLMELPRRDPNEALGSVLP